MKNNLITQTMIAAATLAGAATLHARDIPSHVPTGASIDTIAGKCGLHGLGRGGQQTGKAAEYNGLCDQLTDAEICLAIIKGRFRGQGELREVRWDRQRERASYCLEHFQQELLGQQETDQD